MMDETDGWLILGCLVMLAAAVLISERRTERRLGQVERDTQFLRIVVTTADGRLKD